MSTVKELREKFDGMKKQYIMQYHLMAQLEYTTCWLPENGFHWDKNEPNGIKGIKPFCKSFSQADKPVKWMAYKLGDGTEGECLFPPYSDAVVFNKDIGYVYDKIKLALHTSVRARDRLTAREARNKERNALRYPVESVTQDPETPESYGTTNTPRPPIRKGKYGSSKYTFTPRPNKEEGSET